MADGLTIVTWLWRGPYEPRHVYAVQAMLEAHLHRPYRFVCVTDQPRDLTCHVVPLWDAPQVNIRAGQPNCYKRLYAFSEQAQDLLGEKIISIDLDALILSDVTELFETKVDFKILRGVFCPYNGSLWALRTGSRTQVWNDFDPETSPRLANDQRRKDGQRYVGSDQAWIAYKLPNEKTWTEADGIYQFVTTYINKNRKGEERFTIPQNCKIMFFAGNIKPWMPRFRAMHPLLYRQYAAYCR